MKFTQKLFTFDILIFTMLLSIFIQLTCKIPVISAYLQAEWILMNWFLRSQLIWIYAVFKAGYFQVLPFSMERVLMAFTHRIFDANYLKQPTAGINALLFSIKSGPQQKLPQTLDLII